MTEIRPFGSNPSPRRRVGCALVGSDVVICGGTSPIRVQRGKEYIEILHDHNDVFLLHLGEGGGVVVRMPIMWCTHCPGVNISLSENLQ